MIFFFTNLNGSFNYKFHNFKEINVKHFFAMSHELESHFLCDRKKKNKIGEEMTKFALYFG